jgi:hypothetical protein
MPISYSVDTENRLVLSRAWGPLSNTDLHSYYHALAIDRLFRPDFRELLDLTAVLQFLVDSKVLAEIAAWPTFRAATRRAIVAASDVAFGLSRMFATYAEIAGQSVSVFREACTAEAWLEDARAVEEDRLPSEHSSPRAA